MTNPNDPADTMTIRQRFVMAAMESLAAAHVSDGILFRDIAIDACALADAVLAEEAMSVAETFRAKEKPRTSNDD